MLMESGPILVEATDPLSPSQFFMPFFFELFWYYCMMDGMNRKLPRRAESVGAFICHLEEIDIFDECIYLLHWPRVRLWRSLCSKYTLSTHAPRWRSRVATNTFNVAELSSIHHLLSLQHKHNIVHCFWKMHVKMMYGSNDPPYYLLAVVLWQNHCHGWAVRECHRRDGRSLVNYFCVGV